MIPAMHPSNRASDTGPATPDQRHRASDWTWTDRTARRIIADMRFILLSLALLLAGCNAKPAALGIRERRSHRRRPIRGGADRNARCAADRNAICAECRSEHRRREILGLQLISGLAPRERARNLKHVLPMQGDVEPFAFLLGTDPQANDEVDEFQERTHEPIPL